MLTRREMLQLAAVSPAMMAAGSPASLTVFDYSQVELLDSPCAGSSTPIMPSSCAGITIGY